jgi:AraC-like DNA-binding protein
MVEEPSMDQEFIRKLNETMEANLSNEQFGVNELASEMGLSRSALFRKLKLVTNKSINQFIREVRLKRAMEMLQKNIAPVSEIAFKVGFGSPAYFNTCFHEYFGYPPGEVKKREPGALEPVAEIQEQRPVENVPKGKRMAVRRMVLFTSVGILILLSLTWLFYDKFSRNKVSATSAQLNTQSNLN